LQVGNGISGNLSGMGNVTVNINARLSLNLASGNTFSNTVADNGHLVNNATANYTLAGTVSGTGNMTKIGVGTVTVSGTNLYSGGTTISAGTLLANNTTGSATGTGPVTVSTGATLGGGGTIGGATTLNSGGNIEPGAGSIGTAGTILHANSLHFNGGGTLTFQLGAPSVEDELLLSGPLTKGNSGSWTIDLLDAPGVPLTPTNYTLMTFTSTTFAASNFTLSDGPGLIGGTLAIVGNSLVVDNIMDPPHSGDADVSGGADLTVTGSPGNTVSTPDTLTVTPTPEPGSATLLVLGGAALLAWRRRREQRCG
jgi:fibronectin-binding autotransporter adhesin